MNFLKRLIFLFRKTDEYKYIPEADLPESWTQEDAKHTAEFIGSITGRKLSARLTNYIIKEAVAATFKSDPYENGKARGIALGVKALEAHAIVAPTTFASPVRNTGKSEEQPQEDVAAALALR